MIKNAQEAEGLRSFIAHLKEFLKPAMPAFTEDAIHNWGAPYIAKQYSELPDEIKAAAQEAMVRHHRYGASARDEAEAINHRYGLT